MQLLRGIIAGILLFLGRELNFLFAGATAAFIGLRLTPYLPSQWPWWSDYAFMAALAIAAIALTLANERLGYFLSGFLAGGYFAMEYSEPNVLTFPLLPFILGGLFGAFLIGVFKDWALVLVTCLIGAYYVTNLFRLSSTAQILVASGLFIIGMLTQLILLRMEKND